MNQNRRGHNKISLLPPVNIRTPRLTDFQDLKVLGKGAFAIVYQGNYRNSTVALKRITLNVITDDKSRKSAMEEIEIFKKITHDNIVKCHGSFRECSKSGNDYLNLILEYVNGGDLELWIKNMSSYLVVQEVRIWTIFKQVAAAITYIHGIKVIHRDLKPANVLLTTSGVVKLADFGLSRLTIKASSFVTYTGTPYYMSPERATESNYSYKADIWSLGCILYEMAMLKSPFSGELDNICSLNNKINRLAYPPLHNCYSGYLAKVIQACLCKESKQRPPAKQIEDAANMIWAMWQYQLNNQSMWQIHH